MEPCCWLPAALCQVDTLRGHQDSALRHRFAPVSGARARTLYHSLAVHPILYSHPRRERARARSGSARRLSAGAGAFPAALVRAGFNALPASPPRPLTLPWAFFFFVMHRTPWRALPLEMWCKLCRCMCAQDGMCLAVSRCVRERTHSIGRGHILLARRGLSSSLSRCVRPWQYLFPMPRACAAARHVRPRNTAHHKPKTHTDSSR